MDKNDKAQKLTPAEKAVLRDRAEQVSAGAYEAQLTFSSLHSFAGGGR